VDKTTYGRSVQRGSDTDPLPGVLFYKSTGYGLLSNVYRKFCQGEWLKSGKMEIAFGDEKKCTLSQVSPYCRYR